jgi:hypothetical protein
MTPFCAVEIIQVQQLPNPRYEPHPSGPRAAAPRCADQQPTSREPSTSGVRRPGRTRRQRSRPRWGTRPECRIWSVGASVVHGGGRRDAARLFDQAVRRSGSWKRWCWTGRWSGSIVGGGISWG